MFCQVLSVVYLNVKQGKYWPSHDGGVYGLDVYNAIKDAATRGVHVRILLVRLFAVCWFHDLK